MHPLKERSLLYSLARNRPYLLVMATGVLLALSFPPFPTNFLIFFAFVPLLIVIEEIPPRVFEDKIIFPFKLLAVTLVRLLSFQFLWGKNRGNLIYRRKIISGNAQIFRYSYLAFFIWNLGTCYWLMLTALGAASFSGALTNLVAGVLAITINPVLMTIPFQLFARVRHVLSPVWASLCLAVFWIAFEYLHFNWDLTWSWITLGHALTPWPSLLQYIEFSGILGASAYILGSNVLIYLLVREILVRRKKGIQLWLPAVIWISLPLILNFWILNPERKVFQPTGKLSIRLIQPNFDPFHRGEVLTREERIQRFVNLSTAQSLNGIDLIIFPEDGIPKAIIPDELVSEALLEPLWDIVYNQHTPILTGFTELKFFLKGEKFPVSASPAGKGRHVDAYNAAIVLSEDSPILSHRKAKLVPMVERMPFLENVNRLKTLGIDLTGGWSGFGLPDSLFPLEIRPGLEVGVMICYESEFGDYIRETVLKGADFLAIITNDGWWSNSSGYRQHAGFTVLRAIEMRRDIARAANTGVSLFCDQKGKISAQTEWWTTETLDGEIRLYNQVTFYARNGDYLGWVAGWLTLLILLLSLVLYWNAGRKTAHTS